MYALPMIFSVYSVSSVVKNTIAFSPRITRNTRKNRMILSFESDYSLPATRYSLLFCAHERHEITRKAEELPTEHTDYTEESDVVEFRI